MHNGLWNYEEMKSKREQIIHGVQSAGILEAMANPLKIIDRENPFHDH